MADQQEIAPPVDASTAIGSSLASVWARYVGARPANAETEIEGSVVRWILVDGMDELETSLAAGGEDEEAGDPARTAAGYARESSAAVAKATGRRVVARISKQDKKTGSATQTYILERPLKKH